MLTKRIFYCTFFILFALNVSATEVEDFETACRIFTEAKNTGFNKEKRSAYISDNIKSRTKSKELRDAYNVIFNVSPSERYLLFKNAAEHATKEKWNCPAAKALLK